MSTGRSLHVGLNHVDPNAYNGWDGELFGCINDANAMKAIADSLQYSSLILTDSQATSTRVIQEIANAARSLQAGDILLVSYSGHGGQVQDANSDEDDALDETWVLFDRELIDDELASLWSQFQPGVRIFVVSDSCHSGTVAKQKYTEDVKVARAQRRAREMRPTPSQPSYQMRAPQGSMEGYGSRYRSDAAAAPVADSNKVAEERVKAMPLNIQEAVNRRDKPMYDTLQWIAGSAKDANTGASVVLISGCQDNQLSMDGAFNGAFTEALLRVWDNGSFQGDYQSFHRQILNLMPPEQSPNYYTTGAKNIVFEQERPFTVGSSGGGQAPSTPTTPGSTRPTLRRGSSGPDVSDLQQKLNRLGFGLRVDGQFGFGTEGAVKEFQNQQNLSPDGIVGSDTWNALERATGGAAPSQPGTNRNLQRGDTGPDVVRLQKLLINQGFTLTADGVFGSMTESAVRSFQRSVGLTADGIVGPMTWQALENS
jgi:metacaspase-1